MHNKHGPPLIKIPRGLLCKVLCPQHHKPKPGYLVLTAVVFDKHHRWEGFTMLDLLNTQGVLLTIAPQRDDGKPAPLDGVPVWTNNTPDTIALEASADGLSATVLTLAGAVGVWDVKVEADADLGAGVTPLAASIGGNVAHPQATNLHLEPGVPFEKP